MPFDPKAYGDDVAAVLALDGYGERLMPLAGGVLSCPEARRILSGASALQLFPDARAPQAALAGLWLYFSGLEESHAISQGIHTAEGSFWHGIMHRQEPDPWNAGYWFQRVGQHPTFPQLRDATVAILEATPIREFAPGARWDPMAFIDFCETARRHPGSRLEQVAREIQRAEWQLLFDYCARPRGT